MAVGLGAQVTVLDRSLERLRALDAEFHGPCSFSSSAPGPLARRAASLAGFFWTEEEYNNRLVPIMKDNFKRVWDYSQQHGVKMRRAAFLVAIKRVADALKLKGFFL